MEIVDHFHYQNGKKRFFAEMDDFIPGHMAFLCGPSGVGKTSIRHAVMQEVFGNPMSWGRGRIPIIETFAKLPTAAFFSSGNLVKSFVNELQLPNLKWLASSKAIDRATLAAIEGSVNECAIIWEKLQKHHQTEERYWEVFQTLLQARQCLYVSIDQVTALLVNRKNKSPTEHILHLLSIAEHSWIMFIMTGVHTASRLWQIHSELRRRISTVWVMPYSPNRKEDEVPYLRLLKSVSDRFPLSREDLLFDMADDIMAATAGVFGELEKLLKTAWKHAQFEGARRITKKHLEASYYGNDDLRTLWRDVEEFELVCKSGDIADLSSIVSAKRKRRAGGA